MQSVGSLWGKWDLHIHTPASFEWKGRRFHDCTQAEQDGLCADMVNQMNATDIVAFGIMDYWTFDGYFILRDYLDRNPNATDKTILPGIELRMEAPTNHRLNTHVIFDPKLSTDTLSTFVSKLSIESVNGQPPSKQAFIELGRSYDPGKLRQHGFSATDRDDESKMHMVGLMTALITRDSLWNAIKAIGEDNCLIIQPYDTNDGLEDLDWKRHPYADSLLMKRSHVFEARDPVHVDLFLGFGYPKKPSVGQEFLENLGGHPKPVVSGSDAHRISDYGVYPSDRITWLKAKPTFAGLRQVCCEPSRRCFIGSSPDKREHVRQNPTKYVTSLQIGKIDGSTITEHWFDTVRLELNPGLIAVIGNKGSGKSALADILALAGNSHCREMEFLNNKRFRRRGGTANQFVATLTWADGTPVRVQLDQDPDINSPERVRYLPQQVLEELCNEIAGGGEGTFEKEIKKVIFFHLPEEKRLQKTNLNDLLEFKASIHRESIEQHQAATRKLNADILAVEKEISEETKQAYRAALELKEAELSAHDTSRPTEVPQPVADEADTAAKQAAAKLAEMQARLETLSGELEKFRGERAASFARNAVLSRLKGYIDNFASTFADFIAKHSDEFTAAGFDLTQLVRLTIDQEPLDLASGEVNQRLRDAELAVKGTVDTPGLEALAELEKEAIEKAKGELDAPNRKYQAYLVELHRWEGRRKEIVGSPDTADTIEFFKARIENAENTLPQRLVELYRERYQCVRSIHEELIRIRGAYSELYQPVQEIVAANSLVRESLLLRFDAFFAMPGFIDNFLDFIHRGRKGSFYGDEDSKQRLSKLINDCDFGSADGVVAFLEQLMRALTKIERDGDSEPVSIQSQLRAGKKLGDFYDFLFCLDYLEPRYTLKLGEKDIIELSPGEKGALLLVFYLLLDREEIPIIIDQPEHNLDNESVVRLLVDCIREAAARRQVIIVTHNPNLAVVCDAEQIICTAIDKTDGHRVSYEPGAIEELHINKRAVDVLEGTYRAFDNRHKKYHRPRVRVPKGLPILR